MFQWDKSIKTLDVTVDQVVHLFRSMRDVQLALPGLPAQEASAYLCQYRTPQGIGTAAVFDLHKSGQLAFYGNTPREVAAGKAETMLDQALVFVESMGFLLTDLDIHLLSAADRELLWASLPLQKGAQLAEKPVPRPAAAEPEKPRMKATAPVPVPEPPPTAAAKAPAQPEEPAAPPAPVENAAIAAAPESGAAAVAPVGEEEQANVDDLLAAVEELRTRRPGVRARKKPPSPEELDRRRQELRENIGRILVSL